MSDELRWASEDVGLRHRVRVVLLNDGPRVNRSGTEQTLDLARIESDRCFTRTVFCRQFSC